MDTHNHPASSSKMTVSVRLPSGLEQDVEVPSGSTVGDLISRLKQLPPAEVQLTIVPSSFGRKTRLLCTDAMLECMKRGNANLSRMQYVGWCLGDGGVQLRFADTLDQIQLEYQGTVLVKSTLLSSLGISAGGPAQLSARHVPSL